MNGGAVNGGAVSAPTYPPQDHLLRDLPFDLRVDGPGRRARFTPADVRIDELAVVVDVLAGSLCAGRVAPDWMATSSLAMRWLPGLTAGPPGPIELTARVLRAGSKVVTVEIVGTSGADGPALVTSTVTFSRLPRRADTIEVFGDDEPVRVVEFERLLAGAPARLADRLGPSARPLELDPYLCNSFGALNGGVVVALCHAAAQDLRPGWRTTGVHVHHLGQARTGPVSTTARVELDAGDGTAGAVRVEVRDDGAPDDDGAPRLVAVGHVDLQRTPTDPFRLGE